MSLSFYMDENVHRAITSGLRLRATIGECVRDLELVAQAVNPEEVANQVLFIPL